MNRRAKCNAASFILGGAIRNRTNTQAVNGISTPRPSACVDNEESRAPRTCYDCFVAHAVSPAALLSHLAPSPQASSHFSNTGVSDIFLWTSFVVRMGIPRRSDDIRDHGRLSRKCVASLSVGVHYAVRMP